ncbi:MAG TPA: amidohydrolase family protein [Chloroflexota bacterium]|jgi:aminocarboxymuconate-semialdehyde decarboxylase
MRIDVHAHYFPQEYVDCIARVVNPAVGPTTERAPGAGIDLDERLALMDSAGIDMQVLSASLLHPNAPNEGDAVAAARLGNDLYADACKRYPGRFAAFASVPLPHVDAAIAEVERCIDKLGFLGVATGCTVNGRPLDDPAFDPLWAELNRRETVLFLHPLFIGFEKEMADYGLSTMVGALFEDTVAAARLVASGVTSRYPKMKVIVPHLGGGLPFNIARVAGNIDGQVRRGELKGIDGPARERFRRLWYDTCNHEPAALRCACEVFGSDRLLMGTDFPYAVGDRFRHCVEYVEEAGLSPAETDAILGGTAQELLGIQAPAR